MLSLTISDRPWDRSKGLLVNQNKTQCDEVTEIEDDHQPFLEAGVPAVDIIDLDYPQWHTPFDTLDAVSARSLQVVGDVVLAALPRIERRLASLR